VRASAVLAAGAPVAASVKVELSAEMGPSSAQLVPEATASCCSCANKTAGRQL